MYISNPSNQGSTYKKDEQNQNDSLLRYPDTNANFMQGSRHPSMGSVSSSQNQTTAENVEFATASTGHGKDNRQEAALQERAVSEKTQESTTDEDDRVQRLWTHDLHRSYDRPTTERVSDGRSSPHVSNGRHPGSRGMSPVEGILPQSYSSPSLALYGTNAPHLASHSGLQYTSSPMVQYSPVPGLQTYAPYYAPFVRLPGHPPVMRTSQHEAESYSEMLANIGSRAGQPLSLLPHSLLPTNVQTPFGTIECSSLPSPREYPTPGFAIPESGIYVVGVQSDSRSSSRHPSGDQRQGDLEHSHPHPARERWECHERKVQELDTKNPHDEGRGSRGPSPREMHSLGHHVQFKEPPYQTEVGQERVVYQVSPKVAHVHPLEPAPREERYTHQLPSANIHPLYANTLTIQTSLHSPPQLVSPPATYSSMQLQLSPTPQVRSSTHAASSQKAGESQDVYNLSRANESPKAVVRKEPYQVIDPAHLYHQPTTHKLTANAEYPGSSTFPSYFTRGSVIQLASGELKRVEDLCTEDFIQSAAVTEGLKIDSSTVVRIEDVVKKTVAIISFSVGDQREQVSIEVTLEHPFYVFGHGWSSVKPELTLLRYNLACHKLAVGDVCVSLTPKEKAPYRKEEHTEPVQRTYRSEYLDNKRQRLKYWKTPSDNRDIDHHMDMFIASEQRHHTNTENPIHRYHPSCVNVEKHNKLASELKSLNVSSSSASSRNSSQVIRTSNTSSRSDVKSSGIKVKHSYQTLEEVKEEEEESTEQVAKQKTSHRSNVQEPVEPVAKFTIAR